MAEYKVVNKCAYNAATKLFIKDSRPCHYVATFEDGATVACFGSDARIIGVEYITFAECFADFKHVLDIEHDTAVGYIYNNHSYTLPDGAIALYAGPENNIIAETERDYILVEKEKCTGNFPNNTVLHNVQLYGYCGEFGLLFFRVLTDTSDYILYSSSQIPFMDRFQKHGNVYEIWHNNIANYYYITRDDNSYKLVELYDGTVVELRADIDGAITSKGTIQYVCKYTDCAVDIEDQFIHRATLPGGQKSLRLEFRNKKKFDDELIYVCGDKYFAFNEHYSSMIFAQS